MRIRRKSQIYTGARVTCAAALAFFSCSALSGCLLPGRTNSGDSLLWPGSFALIVVLSLLLWFLFRTR
jgi:hypothetical protein